MLKRFHGIIAALLLAGCPPALVSGYADYSVPELLAWPPRVERASLRVASYNAWLLPFASRQMSDRLHRMPAAIGAFAPDVLCLQEAWYAAQRDALRASLARRLPHAADGSGGLSLLSRHPIAERRFHAFDDDTDLSLFERLGGKGILEVVLVTPAGPLRVLVTHLAHDRGGAGGHDRQLDQLFAHMAARPELPTVLCGDLNLAASREGHLTPGYERMLALGYDDAHPPPVTTDGAFERRPRTRFGWPRTGEGRGWAPDYLLARGALDGPTLRVVRAGIALDTPDTALSDHNLLLGDLVLDRRPATSAQD